MASTNDRAARILEVMIDDESLSVRLADGRIESAPLAWFPRLLHAKPFQCQRWELCAAGFGVRWLELDEELSAAGLLPGATGARRLH